MKRRAREIKKKESEKEEEEEAATSVVKRYLQPAAGAATIQPCLMASTLPLSVCRESLPVYIYACEGRTGEKVCVCVREKEMRYAS